MPTGQDFARRLRDETHRTLAGYVLSFEEEFRALQANLSTSMSSIDQIRQRLGSIRSIDVSSVEAILSDALADAAQSGIGTQNEQKLFLAHFAHDMRRKETQDEILNLLLDGAHRYAPRLMLFVSHGNQFVGWSSRGFASEKVRNLDKCILALPDSPLLRRALDADGLTTAENISQESTLSRLLPERTEGPWHAFPLKAMKRPVAVLLALAAGDRSCDLEALCVLMDLTGLCIENMALKILHEMKLAKPSPPVPEPVAEPVRTATGSAAQSVAVETKPVAEASAPKVDTAPLESAMAAASTAPPPVESPTAKTEPPVETPAEPPAAVPQVETVEPSEESEDVAAGVPDTSGGIAPAEKPGPAVTEAGAVKTQGAEAEEPEPVRTAVLREVQPLTEEERLHADAKRFARLLASEIKLYNEQRVQEGRANSDLYVRLKRDIDRSRDMYEKRVSPVVSRKVDYFHDEIIRVLGDNDPSTLGSDYPGPRVES